MRRRQRCREQPSKTDGEMRRGRRIAYKRDQRQARRDEKMRRRQRGRKEPSRRDGKIRRVWRVAYKVD